MTEEEKKDAATAEKEPHFQLVKSFLKDASLEMPNAPEILFRETEEQPGINYQFEVGTRALPQMQSLYEVVLRVTATVGYKENVLFLVEGKQSGIFEVENIPEETLPRLLNVVSPTMLLPYLRANMADLINRTGLPPIHLPEVNFDALYQQRLAEAQKSENGVGKA